MSDKIANTPELPEELKIETFLSDRNNSIKPLQHKSDTLKAFMQQFEGKPLLKGANQLAELSQLLENEAWCRSHDAAYEAIKTALALVEDTQHADVKFFVESMSKMQIPSQHNLMPIKDNETVYKALAPLASHLDSAINPHGVGRWTQCTARNIEITPHAKAKGAMTIAEAQKRLPVTPSSPPSSHRPQRPSPSQPPKQQRLSIAQDMLKAETAKTATSTTGQPAPPAPTHYSYGTHEEICTDPNCTVDHGASASSRSSGYGGSASYAAEEATASKKPFLERAEQWLRRQKPSTLIAGATATVGGIGLLYLSGKAEQRRQHQREQNASSEMTI